MSTDKKKRGRPFGSTIDNPRDKTLPRVRLTNDQLTAYREAANTENKSLSAWVRDVLDGAIK